MTDQQVIAEILNHVSKLNDETGQLAISIAVLQTQVESITWWLRAMGVATIGMLVTNLGQLWLMRGNNHRKP
jgi:hypothetical protein